MENIFSTYKPLFDPRIPVEMWVLLLVALIFSSIVVQFVFKSKAEKRSALFLLGIMAYSVLVLSNTFLYRQSASDYYLELVPFRSYYEWWTRGNNEFLIGNVLNIILFMPLGMPLGGLFNRHAVKKAVIFGALFSLTIEVLQLVFKRGWFEVDDVLHNTVGCLVGCLLSQGFHLISQRFH